MRKFFIFLISFLLFHYVASAGENGDVAATERLLQLQDSLPDSCQPSYPWASAGAFYTKIIGANTYFSAPGEHAENVTMRKMLQLVRREGIGSRDPLQSDLLQYGWASAGAFYATGSSMRKSGSAGQIPPCTHLAYNAFIFRVPAPSFSSQPAATSGAAKMVGNLHAAAERGDPSAQDVLGSMYEDGDEVTQDYAEALKWFRKSAEQGNPHAQRALARLYADGHGAPKDYSESYFWHLAANAELYETLAHLTPEQRAAIEKRQAEWPKSHSKAAGDALTNEHLRRE